MVHQENRGPDHRYRRLSRSIIAPDPEEIISEGDALIAVGDTEQLKKFIHLL